MLYLYLGTDRRGAHDAIDAVIKKSGKKMSRIRITDANSPEDFDAVVRGGGMFDLPEGTRAVIIDSVFENEEIHPRLLENLPRLKESKDTFYIYEEKLDAAGKRAVGKYAEETRTFDLQKASKDNAIFKLRFALEKGDKKTLWVGLMQELAAGKPPEMTHGFLFWAAKQMVLGARDQSKANRARILLARLAELPQESRRQGFDLEYALERFVLSEL